MNSRKTIFWIVLLSLMGPILLFSCTDNKPSEEKAKAVVDSEAVNKITAINPSKIHVDSEGRIKTKDLSYEEMGKLADVLTELSESGSIQSAREYEELKDNRGRTISMSENSSIGYIRIEYKYDDFDNAISARATVGGKLIAEAKNNLYKGGNLILTEIQYSLDTGKKTYEGLMQFQPGGIKVSEKRISGQKTFEIFHEWPW